MVLLCESCIRKLINPLEDLIDCLTREPITAVEDLRVTTYYLRDIIPLTSSKPKEQSEECWKLNRERKPGSDDLFY